MKERVNGDSSEEDSFNKEISPIGIATIVVMRHAEAEHNVLGQSYITSPNLTPLGQEQSQFMGQFFQENGIYFSSVITSGRPRTNQTADAMGLQGVPLYHEERLHERDSGIYAENLGGRTRETSENLGELLSQLSDEERWDYVPELNGVETNTYETERASSERFNQALIEIAASHPGETILVIAHEGIMRSHLASIKQEELRDSPKAGESSNSVFNGLDVANTGFYILEGIPEQGKIKFKVTDLQLAGIKKAE